MSLNHFNYYKIPVKIPYLKYQFSTYFEYPPGFAQNKDIIMYIYLTSVK